MKAHRLVLSGASGMLGRAILRHLSGRKDVSVVALHRNNPPPKWADHIEHRVLDFNQAPDLERLLQQFQPSVFIQSAATGMQHPVPQPGVLNEVNVELPVRLAKAVRAIPDCHFVQVSSGLAYADQGRPLREEDPVGTSHPYGASKIEAERGLFHLAETVGLPLTIVRPFSFTGEGDSGTRLFPSLLRSAADRLPFQMSRGDQVRDHASVNDIADGIIAASLRPDRKTTSRIFNLGSGDTRTLRDLVTSITIELGLDVDIQFGSRAPTPHEPMFLVADTSHARQELQWEPRETVAQAVSRLASTSFPSLTLKQPGSYV
jgi:nucleoside-diphosphate-sugar epimerase